MLHLKGRGGASVLHKMTSQNLTLLPRRFNSSRVTTIPLIASKNTLLLPNRRAKMRKEKKPTLGDSIDTLQREIKEMWGQSQINQGLNHLLEDVENSVDDLKTYFRRTERPKSIKKARITYQTSSGAGLGLVDDTNKIVLVPKTLPGDYVEIQLARHYQLYAEGELLKVLHSLTERRDELVVCSKFNECSGCQFQMLGYDDQLQTKEDYIKRAYRFYYPELDQTRYPYFGVVTESPMQYAYRSKLTPHYRNPKNFPDLQIGFNSVFGGKPVVDVEYCPIATEPVNLMLPDVRKQERERDPLHNKDKTLFLRETLRLNHKTGEHHKGCITDPKRVCTTRINKRMYQFEAGEFFQNNDYILPEVIDYIKYQIEQSGEIDSLVDTYCGSGFFGIALADFVKGKIFGVEVSEKAIKYADHNSRLNGLHAHSEYIADNSNKMFQSEAFKKANINGENAVVIIDPSRKGSSEAFMNDLLDFGPKLIVYVSCNVFSQARDLAYFAKIQAPTLKYKVREVVGFDFFPQTRHVETVAILERM